MQFSEQWLRQYVQTKLTISELSHVLTMAGLEVEEVKPVAASFDHVVVAHILSAQKHPDADRLQVCMVDVGLDKPLQIVCGASNARAGLKAPCALVGAQLPGIHIKQAKVRGVESFGMMCSEKELGLAEESSGILELPADAPVGQDIRTYFQLDDHLITLKLTPNRSDCLSLHGIARDLSALTGEVLSMPAVDAVPIDSTASRKVRILATEACLRYAGRIIEGVNANAETPAWMVRYIERCGVRSISPIVDITNYVLLEMGQPLHAFDADKIGNEVIVRMAKAQEQITLLNEQKMILDADMVVIADDNNPLALAGVMGGASSAVSDTTQSIFLESAFFTPDSIAGKARKLGLSTDSSYRFERGVDFAKTRIALERASQLIIEICGGRAGEITEVAGKLPERPAVTLRLSRLCAVLGIQLTQDNVTQLLSRLGLCFELKQQAEDVHYIVTPQSYRFDIQIEEDLIEEIARLHGYEHIPPIMPQASLQMLPQTEKTRSRNLLRDILVSQGYQETVNYSFVDQDWEHHLAGNPSPISLKNPIANNMSVMRTSLWGGLLESLVYNLNRKQSRVRLFEIGSTYHRADNGHRADHGDFIEVSQIAGLAYGDLHPEQWGQSAQLTDFFDVKADVELLVAHQAEYVKDQHVALHPGQTARVFLNQKAIGWIGKLHPKWQQHYDLPTAPILFELEVEALLQTNVIQYQEVAKFPPVRRDMAVVVDEQIPVAKILASLKATDLPQITEITLFDEYRGKGIPESKKSLAFLVLMQDTQKTLTDVETDAIMAKLFANVHQAHGAELRS